MGRKQSRQDIAHQGRRAMNIVRIASQHVPPSAKYQYMLDHMWDECPKWPFARNPLWGRAVMRLDGRTRYVHQVVCELVNGPRPTPSHEAAHSCGKGSDGCFGANCVVWKTRTENEIDKVDHGTSNRGSRHGMSRLTEEAVIHIRNRKGLETQEVIASAFGISRATVSDIHNGRRWKWL